MQTDLRFTWSYFTRSHFSRESVSRWGGGEGRCWRSTADSCAYRKDAAQINPPWKKHREQLQHKDHATSTEEEIWSCNSSFFSFFLFFLPLVDLNFVRKGRRTSERLLWAAFNTTNEREWQQLDCTEDIDTFWLGPCFFFFSFLARVALTRKKIYFVSTQNSYFGT